MKTEELAKIGMLETEFGKWKLLVSDGDAKGWEKRARARMLPRRLSPKK